MLQALPNTALWDRLEQEGRLIVGKEYDINQTTLVNFIPTRPIEEIAREYINCFWQLYEPQKYLGRVYRHYINMSVYETKKKFKMPALIEFRALLTIFWRQGIRRSTRVQFWRQLVLILVHNKKAFRGYLSTCAHLEHFIEYRTIVKDEIEDQIDRLIVNKSNIEENILSR
ncbi:MAG: DUF4070 domain-containing protein, partial [Cyanothece sp. SIO2G6]|nr:DUF4070 domain-containing protein [Cyanothece sp. SIO2G6]